MGLRVGALEILKPQYCLEIKDFVVCIVAMTALLFRTHRRSI